MDSEEFFFQFVLPSKQIDIDIDIDVMIFRLELLAFTANFLSSSKT